MRIGIDARFFGGEQSKGLGRYTQKLIQHIAEDELSDYEYVIFVQQEAFDSWDIDNPRLTPVLAPYKWYTLQEQLLMPIKIWQAKVDFMHFPHFNVPLLYWKRFVVTIHDLIIILFPTERATTLGPLLYKFKHWAGQMVMRHAVKRSSHIITVSEFSKKDIVEHYGISERKVTVTYEAADRDTIACSVDNSTSILKRREIKKPFLLYIGNAYPHKNLDILLSAVKEMKENRNGELGWQLVLVGKEDYFYSRLKQSAWAKNIDTDVIFTGFVSDEELPCLYQEALAYIFPSRYEGFGLPPLEAMQNGTPVLAANASCLPEILGDAALYFDPSDISGIINSVKQIEDNPSLRETLIKKGTNQSAKYSWQNMMKETLEVYDAQTVTQKQKHKV